MYLVIHLGVGGSIHSDFDVSHYVSEDSVKIENYRLEGDR